MHVWRRNSCIYVGEFRPRYLGIILTYTIRNVWSKILLRIQSCCCLQYKGELSLYSNLTTVFLTKLSVCVCTNACSAFVMSRKPAKRAGFPGQPSFHLTSEVRAWEPSLAGCRKAQRSGTGERGHTTVSLRCEVGHQCTCIRERERDAWGERLGIWLVRSECGNVGHSTQCLVNTVNILIS